MRLLSRLGRAPPSHCWNLGSCGFGAGSCSHQVAWVINLELWCMAAAKAHKSALLIPLMSSIVTLDGTELVDGGLEEARGTRQ